MNSGRGNITENEYRKYKKGKKKNYFKKSTQ